MFRALVVLVALTSSVFADAKSEADRLFDEGVALRDAGKLDEACVKFAEAMKKDERAIGTLLNLALCAERQGKVATASKLFSEARDRSKEQDMSAQQKAAEEHLATLAPLVPHLTIKLAKPLPGMKILVDDQVVPQDALVDLPVDPGTRAVNVTAPGHLPWDGSISVEKSKSASLDVPELQTSIVVNSSKKTIGKIATIAGGVALVSSIGLALYGKSVYDHEFEAHVDMTGKTYFPCHGEICDAGGQKGTERGRTFGTIATVVGGVGLAAAGVGVFLWVTAPSGSPVTPMVTSESVGVATTLHW